MSYFWDKGMLWIMIDKFQTININSFEALELLQLLFEQKDTIDAQALIDEKEFGRERNA